MFVCIHRYIHLWICICICYRIYRISIKIYGYIGMQICYMWCSVARTGGGGRTDARRETTYRYIGIGI